MRDLLQALAQHISKYTKTRKTEHRSNMCRWLYRMDMSGSLADMGPIHLPQVQRPFGMIYNSTCTPCS